MNNTEIKTQEAGEQTKVTLLQKIVLSLLFIIMIIAVSWVTDAMLFQSRYTMYLTLGKAPAYIVPKGYKIVYSETEKMYSVRTPDGEYLYEGRRGTEPMYLSISKPTLLFDTLEAKAYLKQYIESTQPKVNDFK